MESLVIRWNPDENFWVLHPMMKGTSPFSSLYKNDKSSKKSKSSVTMWAIAMYCDIHEENPYRNINLEDKQKIIGKDRLNEENYDWSKLEEYIEAYPKFCMSPAERHLRDMYDTMDERGLFIKDLEYTVDSYDDSGNLVEKGTWQEKDRMIAQTAKLFDSLKKIEESLNAEQAQTRLRGGAKESLTDMGRI